ncbi:MAG: RNA-guided pseudouridylation complex pseudouridine synthase subunit Cbf5 [Thermoprotei archaeon]
MSGVLPLALEKATRALKPLIDSDKEYVCLMRLHDDVDEREIREVLGQFQGEIYQRPPLRSSVKRVRRIRKIYKIEVLEIEERDVLLRARVDPGTYMRKLCVDVGYALGVEAHMEELRRTKSGIFDEKTSFDLYDVYEAAYELKKGNEEPARRVVRPIEEALKEFPQVIISDAAVDPVCRGMKLRGEEILMIDKRIQEGTQVVVATRRGEAVALAISRFPYGELASNREPLQIKRVIMDAGTYPRLPGSA